MRWFWIVFGVLLAFAAGYVLAIDFTQQKHGYESLSIERYNCQLMSESGRSGKIIITVEIPGSPPPNSVVLRFSGQMGNAENAGVPALREIAEEPTQIALQDDGQFPDIKASDHLWSGLYSYYDVNLERSVCVIARRGRSELFWLAPPLDSYLKKQTAALH